MEARAYKQNLILGLKWAIEAKFDQSDWQEVAYLIDEIDTITEHPRLLRSLHWGDSDYGACILAVLEEIATKDISKLEKIAEYVDLEESGTEGGIWNLKTWIR